MSRLIDADALKEKYGDYYAEEGTTEGFIGTVGQLIDNAPTVKPELSDEQIEKIADLLEIEWGYEGIREDVSRILKGGEQ